MPMIDESLALSFESWTSPHSHLCHSCGCACQESQSRLRGFHILLKICTVHFVDFSIALSPNAGKDFRLSLLKFKT